MRILVLDTETTGTDPETCGVVEYAHAVVDTETRRVTGHQSWLCHPGEGRLPIPPEARAVHHISERDIEAASAPPLGLLLDGRDFRQVDVFCAHNAEFDRGFLRSWIDADPSARDRPWICTYRVARHLWPEAPGFGNQVLRYWTGVEPAWPWPQTSCPAGPEWVPHRALYDVCTTAALLVRQIDHAADTEELVRLTNAPVLLRTCGFGKHRGTLWSEVPRDYLRWMVKNGVQADDRDTTYTVRHYLDLPQ